MAINYEDLKPAKQKNLTYAAPYLGKKYTKLTMIEVVGVVKGGLSVVKCLCDCGVEKLLLFSKVKAGEIQSCGCFRMERVLESFEDRKVNGLAIKDIPEAAIYFGMRSRASGSGELSKLNYLDQGVKVSARWMEPEGAGLRNFLADMGPRPDGYELDRIDPYGDYTAENCRWTSRKINQFNKRLTRKNTSGRTGVYFPKGGISWVAYITVDKKVISLGSYKEFEDAVKAREEAELKYYGFVKIN